MRIVHCEQRSPEWYATRLGVPTASEFGSIITPKRCEYSAAAETYINILIDEINRPEAERGFGGNWHTARGISLEKEARDLYALEFDVSPQEVGFVLNDEGTLGCSPDSLILPSGGLEIKCPDGPTFLKWMRNGGLPDEHKPQVHGSLLITGLEWWDFLAYCPPYPRLLVRVVPDDFTSKLKSRIDQFLVEYEKAREFFNNRIRGDI